MAEINDNLLVLIERLKIRLNLDRNSLKLRI